MLFRSKRMALLNLPEQAKRLIKEGVSADIEVINSVRTIEKADPAKAKALVDKLKSTQGKGNARDQVAAVKVEVKPSKKQLEAKKAADQDKKPGGTVATAKDRKHEEPSAGEIFVAAHGTKADANTEVDVLAILEKTYVNIFEMGANVSMQLQLMSDDQEDKVTTWLQDYYEAGKQSKDTGRGVVQGFRTGKFSSDGARAFALVAFLQGADSTAKFNVANILASAKE